MNEKINELQDKLPQDHTLLGLGDREPEDDLPLLTGGLLQNIKNHHNRG